MSMNLYIRGERDVSVVKHPNIIDKQCIHFNLIQTPTTLTYKVLDLKDVQDQIACYKEWILQRYEDEEEVVYDDSEVLSWADEPTIVGKKIVNYGVEHIKELDSFLEECKNGYYDVCFYTI